MPDEKKVSNPLAVIQIRGNVGVNYSIKNTLGLLNLNKKHNCIVVPNNPHFTGMLKKVKDYVTWGEINAETQKLLEKKTKKGKTYLLSPPKGGFERKGIKKPFSAGGVLGHRGAAMNDLIKKMV